MRLKLTTSTKRYVSHSITASITTVACLSLLLLSGCGGDSSSNADGYLIPGTVLEGSYSATTRMNGYRVISEIQVDPDGDFMGLAYNTTSNSQPNTIYRVIKGGISGEPLLEFDLINRSINKYVASAQQKNDGKSLLFSFSQIPSSLTRPTSLLADRKTPKTTSLSTLVGSYRSSTVSLLSRVGSRVDITRTSSDDALRIRYQGNDGCELNGSIDKRSYQREYADVKGKFSGYNCPYTDQYFKGLISYDYDYKAPFIIGTTTNNSDAFVISALL